MITTVLVGLGKLVSGVAATGFVIFLRLRQKPTPTEVVDGLTESDRSAVARDFAVHVSAVQRKVSEFADALADGDEDLRDRLRHFEHGGDQS